MAAAKKGSVEALLRGEARELDKAGDVRGIRVVGHERRRQVEAAGPKHPAHGREGRLDVAVLPAADLGARHAEALG